MLSLFLYRFLFPFRFLSRFRFLFLFLFPFLFRIPDSGFPLFQTPLENKVPSESEDWRLPYLIDNCKGQVSSFKESAALLPISLPANPPENLFYNGFSVNNGANSTSSVSVRFHPYQLYNTRV